MNWKVKELLYVNGWLLTIISVVWCGRLDDTAVCKRLTTVASTYLQNSFGRSPTLQWTNHNGRDLRICRVPRHRKVSCCSKKHENTFKTNAFKFVTDYNPKPLSDLISDESKILHAQVLQLLAKTKQKTRYHLNQSYHIPDHHFYPALSDLFSELANYVSPTASFDPTSKSPVPELVEKFFMKIFPAAFIFHFNTISVPDIEIPFDCMQRIYKDLNPKPFHNYPRLYATELDSILTAYRDLLGSLQMSAKLLNRSMTTTASDICINGLIRLRLCHLCGGHNVSLPCRDFCLNVYRGCFAHLLPLRRGWIELMKVSGRLVDAITTKFDLVKVLNKLNYHTIKRSFIHATHTISKYAMHIITPCHKGSNSSSIPNITTLDPPLNAGIFDNNLQQRLNVIRSILTNNQLFFDTLPDQYCKGLRIRTCWNGTYLSNFGYARRLQEFTTSAQPVNPEVQMKAPASFSTTQVENENRKLLHLAKTLSRMLDRIFPSSIRKELPTWHWSNKRGQIEGSGTLPPFPKQNFPEDDEENPKSSESPLDVEGSGSGQGRIAGMHDERQSRLGEMEYVSSPINPSNIGGQRKNVKNSGFRFSFPLNGILFTLIIVSLTNRFGFQI